MKTRAILVQTNDVFLANKKVRHDKDIECVVKCSERLSEDKEGEIHRV